MKKIFTLFACSAMISLQAQVTFWTEDFGSGCNRGQTAAMYTGSNGAWAITNTGTNESDPNNWFVSATASGTSAGACNNNCTMASVTNRTLHIGNPAVFYPGFANIGADTGSTYLTGTFCPIGICSITNKRAESPNINTTGYSGISISFLYYENGENSIDDASLYYSSDGGASWNLADALAKTVGACASVLGGTWTAITIPLPAAVNNIPNLKIGFNWTNDGNGSGSDPSFAVDDIQLMASSGGPTLTTGAITGAPFCAGASLNVPYTISGTYTAGNIFTAQLSDGAGSFASPTNIGTLASTAAGSISCTLPAGATTAAGYMIRIVSSTPIVTGTSSAAFTINALPTPTATNTGPYCPFGTIQLNSPTGSATDDWTGPNSYAQNNMQNPTISNATVAMGGVYTVTVTDGAGCSATATTTVVVNACVGLENVELTQVNLYPNPASDMVTLSMPETMVNHSLVSIMNMVGETVYTVTPGQEKLMISTNSLGLRSGIYLVKISYLNDHKVIKLIVR
jgi:hypothetical protein